MSINYHWAGGERNPSILTFAGVIAKESLRLLENEIARLKVDHLTMVHLPVLEPKIEGACYVVKNPKTGMSLRVTMGYDMVHRCLSGNVAIQTELGIMREPFTMPSEYLAAGILDSVSKEYIWPAVKNLVDRIAPIRAILPPMRADFSYQSGV